MGRKTGRVSIGVDRGNLRLRWRHEGKRYTLALGLPDDASNREIALMKAEEIEKDLRRDAIVPEAFDPTCAKYREDAVEMLSVWELFAKYVEDYKRKTLEDPRSLEKYKGLTNHLKVHFHNKAAQSLNEKAAFEFRDGYLKRVMGAQTASGHLGSLRECWRWAQKRKLVKDNPWLDVKVKVPASPKPKPLTEEHVEKILECVQTNPKFTHWADFIRFCLSVGCRPGEAAGLQWKHLNNDCSEIWMHESFGRGRQKTTKTNNHRTFDLFPALQQMLIHRRGDSWSPDDRVFTSPDGFPIDDHNFRKRLWKPLLESLNIPYIMPRKTRQTFISHALNMRDEEGNYANSNLKCNEC